jgi:serine/threonine protein kinase
MNRFTQEGPILASLHHPNLVQVYETNIHRPAESSETLVYIASEYVDGYTLTDYLHATSHRGNFPSIADIVYIFTNIGAAIDYAHENGMIHGNIKPGNILLNKQNRNQFIAGAPMLSDSGIMQIVGDTNGISSPQYISPEQAVGDPATGSSDIYALGVILYEICTGVVPFRDESSVAVMMQHINTLPTPPALINPNIPPALSEVILRAMAKDAATRFSRASLLATAIVDACSNNPSQPLAQQALSKEESSGQSPTYAPGTIQSILGVPQPAEYMHGYFSRPLQGLTPRQPAATTRPFTRAELASESLPSELPADFKEAKEANGQSAIEPSPVTPETPDPDSNTSIQAVPSPINTTHSTISTNSINTINTASRLSTPQTSIRPPIQPDPPFVPFVQPYGQDAQTQSMTIPIRSAPSMPERPRMETFPLVPAPPAPPPMPPRIPKTSSSSSSFTDGPLYIVVISLVLLLLLVGGAIGANLFLNHGTQSNIPGQVFFQDDALGRNDQVRIELANIGNPSSGSNYVAWLQDENDHAQYLGVLPVINGKVSYLYPGNAKHDNLLSFAKGIIITTESAGSTPKNPSDHIVYQAAYDTTVLPNLRNLLYSTPGLPEKQAVTASMFENIKSINDKAVSIVDSLQSTHDTNLAQRQATRIIELIDGSAYARSSGDLPAKLAGRINVNIGLFSSPGQKGYIDLLDEQLNALKDHAGNNQALLQHIANAQGAVVDLRDWVQKMRVYDVQILKAANLADPAITSIALQLKQEAANSYTGRVIPPDSSPRPTLGSAGAYQAYTETQYMAALNLKAA